MNSAQSEISKLKVSLAQAKKEVEELRIENNKQRL
jgi:hypothetical protein